MGARILVVEHQQVDLDEVIELLGKSGQGHELVIAKDCESGLEAARQHRPNLILCAIAPPSSGIEILRQLRLDADYDQIRIVAVKVLPRPDEIDELIGRGFSGVIRKPLTPDFVSRVANFLRW